VTGGQTNGQNYDSQDRAGIAASCVKNLLMNVHEIFWRERHNEES